MRVALGLEYDGSRFSGWQSQPDGNTVQDTLETALALIAGEPVRTMCAGRTDAGVHAMAQVVHFDTEANRPISAWVRGVNAHLPTTVAVRWAVPVAPDFHARFAARERSYCYLLLNRPERPGLWVDKVGWYHRSLDLDRMRSEGRGVVVVTAHMSNFDLAGLAFAYRGVRLTALGFAEPTSGYNLQNQVRLEGGIEFLPIEVSALRKALEVLRRGGIVATGIDRPDPFGGGEMVPFFGRPARLPVPARRPLRGLRCSSQG